MLSFRDRGIRIRSPVGLHGDLELRTWGVLRIRSLCDGDASKACLERLQTPGFHGLDGTHEASVVLGALQELCVRRGHGHYHTCRISAITRILYFPEPDSRRLFYDSDASVGHYHGNVVRRSASLHGRYERTYGLYENVRLQPEVRHGQDDGVLGDGRGAHPSIPVVQIFGQKPFRQGASRDSRRREPYAVSGL